MRDDIYLPGVTVGVDPAVGPSQYVYSVKLTIENNTLGSEHVHWHIHNLQERDAYTLAFALQNLITHFGWTDAQRVIDDLLGDREVLVQMLNIRSGPGADYDIIGQLVAGDKVTIQKQEGEWVQIGEGQWVFSQYLR